MARIFRRRARRPSAARQFAGLQMVPSFHPDLVLGVATYALELFRTAPDLDILYVPIGQGSGICGCIMARDLLGLKTEIVGVQSTEAPSYALSFAAGTVVTTETSNTLADGMATRIPDADALCDHPQGRLAYRAGHRRRGRRTRSAPTGPIRTISPKAQAQPRSRQRLQEKAKLARQAGRPDPDRRQYRFRSVPQMGRDGCHGNRPTGVGVMRGHSRGRQ